MRPELAALLSDAKHSADIASRVNQLCAMADKTIDYGELADIAAVLHKAGDAFDEVKKVLNKASDTIGTKAAQLAVNSGDYGPIKTDLVTASIKSKSWYHLPSSRKADPARFDAIMKANGVPEDIYTNELVRFHGPAIANYSGDKGKPISGVDGGDLSTTVLYLSYRFNKAQ